MLRRRGRRKKSEIVSFSISEANEKRVSFDGTAERKAKDALDGKSISFGALDIVVHTAKDVSEVGFSKSPYSLNKTATNEFNVVHEKVESLTSTIDLSKKSGVIPNIVKRRQVNQTASHVSIYGAAVPESSDAACWWCCHRFTGRPSFLPLTYDEEQDSFRVQGNFCSWNCAKSYNFANKSSKWAFRSMLLKLMVTKLEGKCITIRPAPPRDQLKFFGGDMTIDEFRDGNDKNFSTNPTGLVKTVSSFEERTLQNSRRAQYIT